MKELKDPLSDLCDVAYLAKRSSSILDDLRKEFDRLSELAQRIACLHWIKSASLEASTPPIIRGEFASGTPDLKINPTLPRFDKTPNEFSKMLNFILKNKLFEAIRFHWPTIQEINSDRAEVGEPSIPGVLNEQSSYRLLLRERRDHV